MKPGHVLDTEIALNVMDLEIKDPFSVSPYSTDIWHCYTVVNKLQLMGWSCNVKSNVTASGILSYTARFHLGNKESQFRATSLPMAVCMAALAITKEEYVEFVVNEKGSSEIDDEAEIIDMNSLLNKSNPAPVSVEENPVEDLLIDEIASIIVDAVFDCNQPKKPRMKRILNGMKNQDLSNVIPIQLAQQIIDRLQEKGYSILKKK